MFHDYGYMAGMHSAWWMLGIVVLIALLVWWRPGSPPGEREARETPHQILKRRLAAGEISTEDYDQRKALLDRDA